MGMLERLENGLSDDLARLERNLAPGLFEKYNSITSPELKSNINDFLCATDNSLVVYNLNGLINGTRIAAQANKDFTGFIKVTQSEYEAVIQDYSFSVVKEFTNAAMNRNYAQSALALITSTVTMLQEESQLRNKLIQEMNSRDASAFLDYFGELAGSIEDARCTRAKINDDFEKMINRITVLNSVGAISEADYKAAVDLVFTIRRDSMEVINFIQKTNKQLYQSYYDALSAKRSNHTDDLAVNLIAIFFLNRQTTAAIGGITDILNFFLKILHHIRDRRMAKEINLSPLMRAAKRSFSMYSYEVQAVVSKLRRIEVLDVNSSNFASYTDSKARLSQAVTIIGKEQATFKEKVALYADHVLHKVDRKAFLSFSDEMAGPGLTFWGKAKSFSFYSGYKNYDDMEKEVHAYCKYLLCSGEQSDIETLHVNIQKIIDFYYRSCIDLFNNSDLLAGYSDDLSYEEQQLFLRQHIVALLNRELSDPTPAAYNHSPLCGLAKFIAERAGHGNVSIYLDGERFERLGITYSGEDFDKLEAINKRNFKKIAALHAQNQEFHQRNFFRDVPVLS